MIPGLSEWRLEVTMAIGDPFCWTAAEKGKKGVVRSPSGQNWPVLSKRSKRTRGIKLTGVE
jgi:hypothetical protein